MKRTCITFPLALFSLAFAIPLTAGDETPPQQILKQRHRINCDNFLKAAQTKSQFELQVGSVKTGVQKETEAQKQSDETIQLGMKMKALCDVYVSDPSMTPEKFLSELHNLEDQQRRIEKHFIVGISGDAHISAEPTVIVTPASKSHAPKTADPERETANPK